MLSDPTARLSAALEGRYRIERQLGEGGMSTVYLAHDLRHEREIALKVLKPELAAVVGADRFLAEIKTTANLQHPHILPLFDSGEAEGFLYYLMPHVEGESVRDRIRKEGSLPVADALRIATECGDALAHAHQRGVIHRDVKPGNILLSAGHAVVADFGVARALEAAGGGDALTSTGVSLGTVGYMSPEQASGERRVDARADVYALGCLLYEMLAGEPPFRGSTPYAVMARQLEGPEPITKVRRSVPEAVERVIGKACEPTPGDRFRSAEEFVQALRDVERRPAGAGRRGQRTVKVLGAAATVVLIGLGAWAAISWPFGASTLEVVPSLAVLPLENRSPDPENAFFAAGMHDEILTQLSRVDGIKTISRRSVLRYQDTEKSLTDIAEELGVSWILEGSIQVVGDDVRVSVQLSDAREDRDLWLESYDRELSDILQIQTDLAIRVVEDIGGVLTPEERAQLAQPPTDNEEAYAHYLRGHDLRGRLFSERETLAAAAAYQRAAELDPTFAGAWARLVQMRTWLAWVWGRPDERAAALSALGRLERLAPDAPELHYAQGLWLYYGVQTFEEALGEFDVLAADPWPDDPEVMLYRGATYRRLGRWDESLRDWERALERDPANGFTVRNLGGSYSMMRRFGEAERYSRLAVTLEPELPVHWWGLIFTRLCRGDLEAAVSAVDSARIHLGEERLESGGWWALWQVYSGRVSEVLPLYQELYREPGSLDGTWLLSWDLGLAGAAAAGSATIVHGLADTLRAGAERALPPGSTGYAAHRSRLLTQLAVAHAYLGSDSTAIRLTREAMQEYPVSRDALWGANRVLAAAHVDAVVGHLDDAVDRLRYLLSIPAEGVTVPLLRIDPRWHRLRDHPGFQALLEEAEPS